MNKQQLTANRWRIFPITKDDRKRPKIKQWQKRASSDEKVVRALFLEGGGDDSNTAVGLATGRDCGHHGVFVVDVDEGSTDEIYGHLTTTFTVRTPSGGIHFYYHYPESRVDDEVLRNVQGGDGSSTPLGLAHVDVRADGGYVVAPGQELAPGACYEVIDDAPMVEVPRWFVERMRAWHDSRRVTSPILEAHGLRPSLPSRGMGAVDRARRYAEKCAGAVSGSGGHTVTMALTRALVGGFALGEADALDILLDWNKRCQPPWTIRELEHKVQSAMTTPDPRGMMKGHMLAGASSAGLWGSPDDDGEWFIGEEKTGDVKEKEETSTPPGQEHNQENPSARHVPPPSAKVKTPVATNVDETNQALLTRWRALGGLCELVPEWILSGAEYRQPGLALAATLALGSVMGARRWTYRRATSSVLIGSVAPTASGKGRPQSALASILSASWPTAMGANDLSSTPSTVDRIATATANGHGLLLILDEYGPRLKALLKQDGYQKDMRALLLSLATIGTSSYFAAQSRAKGGEDKELVAPGLTILGSSTPEALHDAVGKMAIEDGFVGRHLWFEAQQVLPPRNFDAEENGDLKAINAAVRACAEAVKAWHMARPQVGKATTGVPKFIYEPTEVVEDVEASKIFRAFAMWADDCRRAPSEGDPPAALLGRAAEHAMRVALCLAVLAHPWELVPLGTPRVSAEIAEVACDTARASLATISRSLREHAAETEWHKLTLRVTRAIKDATGVPHEGQRWAAWADVMRTSRLPTRDLAAVVEQLVEVGDVVKVEAKSGGRPLRLLRLV